MLYYHHLKVRVEVTYSTEKCYFHRNNCWLESIIEGTSDVQVVASSHHLLTQSIQCHTSGNSYCLSSNGTEI